MKSKFDSKNLFKGVAGDSEEVFCQENYRGGVL